MPININLHEDPTDRRERERTWADLIDSSELSPSEQVRQHLRSIHNLTGGLEGALDMPQEKLMQIINGQPVNMAAQLERHARELHHKLRLAAQPVPSGSTEC